MPTVRTLAGLLVPALAALALIGCATLQVGSDYDKSVSFANYHAFALMQREHKDTDNPLVPVRAEDAIRDELTRRGYQLVSDPASADFVVDFTIGSQERTQVTSYPYPYAGPWWGGGYWWGGPYWGGGIDTYTYQEGTLSIDVFDGHTHRPVWHGWAKKTLSRSDIEHSEGPIKQAVAQVLGKFPPT